MDKRAVLPVTDEEFALFTLEFAGSQKTFYQQIRQGDRQVNLARFKEWVRLTCYYRPEICQVVRIERPRIIPISQLQIAGVPICHAGDHAELEYFTCIENLSSIG